MKDIRTQINEERRKKFLTEEDTEEDKFSLEDAKNIGNKLNVDWEKYDENEFHIGLNVELEHGKRFPKWNVTDDDPIKTAKIALAHLEELPNYYTLLKDMEEQGKDMLKNK